MSAKARRVSRRSQTTIPENKIPKVRVPESESSNNITRTFDSRDF